MQNLSGLTRPHLINRLKLDLLPEEERVELLDQVSGYLNEKLLLRIFETVQPGDQKKLREIIQTGTEEEMGQFISEKVPNFLDIISEEIDLIGNKLATYGQKEKK